MIASLWFALVLVNINGGHPIVPFVFSNLADCQVAAKAADAGFGGIRAKCVPVQNYKPQT